MPPICMPGRLIDSEELSLSHSLSIAPSSEKVFIACVMILEQKQTQMSWLKMTFQRTNTCTGTVSTISNVFNSKFRIIYI